MGDSLSPSKGRRILVVTDVSSPDGAGHQEVAYRLAHLLRRRGHQVRMFAGRKAPAGQEGRLDVEEADGLRVWRMSVVSPDPAEPLGPPVGARLRSVLEAEQPELVYFHDAGGLGFSLVPLVRGRGLPTVVTLAGGDSHWATGLGADGTSRI